MNMDSVVVVKIDNKRKFTAVKRTSDCPFYNEYFVFEFFTTYQKVIDKNITITVIQPSNIWRKRKTLGYVTLDVATVWNQKSKIGLYRMNYVLSRNFEQNNLITSKFHANSSSVLPQMGYTELSKNEASSGPRGYIKIDISVLAKGEVPRVPVNVKNDEIEGNLLLPKGAHTERQKAFYIFNIFRCLNIVEKFSNVVKDIEIGPSDKLNASGPTTYVEITFAGITVRTSIRKNTSCPEFNEKLTIIDLFPPLCQRIKIELCYGDTIKKSVQSLKFINLNLISNDKEDGFVPTFGPTFLHMYTDNRLEGFAGTILMSMNTELEELIISDAKNTIVQVIPPLNEQNYFRYEDVTLFACIFDVTAINKKYTDKPVSIRMTFGNVLVQKMTSGSGDDILLNSSDPQKPKRFNRNYYNLKLGEAKPCLWIQTELPNVNKRMYNTNLLSRIVKELKRKLKLIENMFESQQFRLISDEIDQQIQESIDFISTVSRKYVDIVSSYTSECHTNLDKERKKMCLKEMNDIVTYVQTVYDKNSKKRTFRNLQKICTTIEGLIEDVQDCWPDVFLWLIHGNKKVAYVRIPARDVIYSPVLEETGEYCGVKRTILFYANEKDKLNLACKVDVLLMLYLNRHKNECMKNIPSGFKFEETTNSRPRRLFGVEKYVFQLKAHLFQGKITAGFDKTGLADPFARIIAGSQVKDTQAIHKCLNPIWDETLVFDGLVLYGSRKSIQEDCTTIVVEVFDSDEFVRQFGLKKELIGRTLVTPIVKFRQLLDLDQDETPKLEWVEVYNNDEVSAEVLAVFEYIEVSDEVKDDLEDEAKESRKHEIISIPSHIKPKLVPHNIEVLFWGVRNLGKINLLPINRPRVAVICGDQILNSDTIENANWHPNFSNFVKCMNMILPIQEEYAPPIRIKIYDSRRFGVFVYGGVHITNISRFVFRPMTDEDRISKLSGLGYKSLDSLISQESSIMKVQMKLSEESSVKHQVEKYETQKTNKKEAVSSCLIRLWNFLVKPKKAKSIVREVSSVGTYEKLPQEDDIDSDDFDWWMKFHASLEESDEDYNTDSLLASNVHKLRIYRSELELQPEFNGFTDVLKSFKMYKGKKTGDEAIDEEHITAIFKGSIQIYRWPLEENIEYVTPAGWPVRQGVFVNSPVNHPLRYLLRVYCVRALGLRPKDINGKSDPYLLLTLDNEQISDRSNVIKRQIDPVFGRCFEFNAVFPKDHNLKIAVWDHDVSTADDLIGQTDIDLEKRYYTKHRAQCGIAEHYEESGYCAWRGQNKPSSILADLCKRWNTEAPKYAEASVGIGFKQFAPPNFIPSEDPNFDKEVLALAALRLWNEMPVVGFPIVPEHVETRSLYDPSKPGIEQGKLQLWIDIFPVVDLPPPKKVDITPRKPTHYELRVIVWNTEEVTLDEDDFFTGDRKSDIYVKGWLVTNAEAQYTDVHYRSLTGEGNFNWRFIFRFEYLPTENKLVARKKESVFALDETESKIPCRLTLQVWDNDTFSKDDFLGTLVLELAKLNRGAKTVNKCNLALMQRKAPHINLFKLKRTKGWWPFRSIDKKTKLDICTGKIEIEMEILTREEADKEPAGLGRHEPQALPPPKRPDTSFSWFRNPFKAFKHVFCKLYRWKIIKALLFILLVAFVCVGFYAFPGYTVKRLLGAK